jgi:HJR/Mrr/RecB family endonuclease
VQAGTATICPPPGSFLQASAEAEAEMERIVNELAEKKAQQEAKDTAESEEAKRYGPTSAEALKQQVAAQPPAPETESSARLAQLLKEQEEAARKALEALKKPETPPIEEPPVVPELEPLRRVTRAEQTPEDVTALTETGLIEIYKDQPVLTQAGIDALPETERPRLNPEARKIQIDTGSNEVVAEAIAKGLRIGVDQVGSNVTMPQGWTLEGDIYIPPAPVVEPPVAPPVTPPVQPPVDELITIFNYDEKVKPIQDQIDAKFDELEAGGMTFEDARQDPSVRALYEKRYAMDRSAINSYRDIVYKAFSDQGITNDNLGFTPASSISEDIYGAPRRSNEGFVSRVYETGQRAFNNDKATIRKLSEAIFKYRAENEGLDPEGLLGPISGLGEEGKQARVDEARIAAETIHNQIKNSMLGEAQAEVFVTPPVALPPITPTAGAITEEQANNIVKTAQEERAKKTAPTIGRSRWGPQSIPPKTIIGGTAREALKTVSRLNLSKIAQSSPNEIVMQDVAAILAELKMPILDLESVASLSDFYKKGRPRRWPGIDSVIGMPSTIPMPVEFLVHEVGHTLAADQIGRYLPRKKTGSGKAYLDALNKAIADPKTPEAVSRLFSLYVSAIDQLGITEQYFGAKGIAGTPKADTSKALAKNLQAKGLLRGDLRGDDLYGLANVEEFVSQTFSETSFRNILKGLKDPTNPQRTMWQAFVDAIQSILQLPKGSMAAGVIQASVDVGMTVPSDREAFGRGRAGVAPSPAPRPSLITRKESARFMELAKDAEADMAYAGEQANIPQFMRDSLSVAQAMAAKKADPETIRNVTGWIVNPYDGKLRWEIPDNNASLTNAWDNLVESPMLGAPVVARLGDILSHPQLFKAYPDIADVTIVKRSPFLDFFRSIQGSYNDATNEIIVTPYAVDPLSTLLHEIQHWIQNKEGFARGSNTQKAMEILTPNQRASIIAEMNTKADDMARLLRGKLDEAWQLRDHLRGIQSMPEKVSAFDLAAQEKRRTEAEWRKASDSMPLGDPVRTAAHEANEAAKNNLWKAAGIEPRKALETWNIAYPVLKAQSLDQILKKAEEDFAKLEKDISSPYNIIADASRGDKEFKAALDKFGLSNELYRRVAGEIEARDVQSRAGMTPEERTASEPYSSQNIAPELAIVTFTSPSATTEEADMGPEAEPEEGTPEASTMKVMGKAFQMADEQSAANGTPEGTLPMETIVGAWMNSGFDVDTLENAIIRYTNLGPEVAETLAEAIGKQREIQRGIMDIADAAQSRKAEEDEEPEIKPYSFAERIKGELPPVLRNKIQLVYEVLRNEVSVQEANQAMSGLTVDEAITATKEEKNGIRMPVRSMMAQIVLRKIMAQRKATKGKKGREADYEAAVEAHVDFFNWTSEYFKELGQGVQAIARFSDLGADGILLKVKKSVEKATRKHITNRKGQIDKIKRDVEEADSAAFKAALNANKGSMDATADKAGNQEAKMVTIEEQAQKLAQRAAKKVAGEEVRRRQPDPLSELVNGHLRRYNANFIAEATAMGVSPVTAQAIEDSAIKLRDSRQSAKAERERFKDMQEERMKVKKELARENKYIYGERPTIWEDYQEMFSERLARRLMRDPKKKVPPSLLLFTDRLTENLLGFVPEAKRQATTQRSFQAMIEDALNNKEKYQEAFSKAMEDISLKVMELEARAGGGEAVSSAIYKKALAAQEFMERLEPVIQQFPVSDKLIIRFVNQKTKAIGESITAKYNQWGRSSKKTRSEIEMELAEKLVEDIKISDSDAIKLSRAIIKDFGVKAEERREKALARFRKPKEKTKRLKDSPLKTFFELVNIGAMTDEDAYAIMAHRFELPTWDEKFAKQIYEMATIVQDMPEGLERRRLTRNMMAEIARKKGFSISDLGAGFAYSNMLSSVETFLINLQDTLFNNWFNGFASAAADRDFTRMRGLLAGYRKGWQEAIQVFQTGLRINMPRLEEKTPLTVELINYGKKGGVALESNRGMNAIAKTLLESPPAKILNTWKYVTRIMEATDALNYVASSEGQRYAEAAKMANDEGLEGKEKTKRINQILNLGDDVYQAALKQAESEGYTGTDMKFRAMEIQDGEIDADLREKSFDRALVDVYRSMPTGLSGFFAAKFNGLVMAFPNAFIRNAFKILIAPFVITPTNVFNRWLDWSPYGYKRLFLGSGNLTDKDGPYYVAPPKVGSAEFWAQTYKASSSVLVFLMAEGLIRAGLLVVNGMGPSDEEERKQWLADGNRPHTFSFMGGPQISYQYTPWALVLSWRANYDNWAKYQAKKDASLADRGLVGLLSATSVIMDLPFFAGPADFLDFVQSKTSGDASDSVSKYVEGKMGAVFPNFLRHIDRIFDPTLYDSRGIKGIILDQTPFARRLGTQKVNLFGDPIGEDKPTMDRLIGRIVSSPVKPSRESRILAKYDIYPYMPTPRRAKALVDGEEAQMTEEQYNKFVKIVGSQVKQEINSLFDPEGEVSETEMKLGKKRISQIFERARARGVREVSTY